MAKNLNIDNYDTILRTAMKSLQTLGQEVSHALAHRTSTLEAYSFIGLCAAELYTAMAYAGQYLLNRMWEKHPERLPIDEENYGMVTYYYANYPIKGIDQMLANAVTKNHYYTEIGEIEYELTGMLTKDIEKSLKTLFMDLIGVISTIYHQEHPDVKHAKEMRALHYEDPTPVLCPVQTRDLMTQQAYCINTFPTLEDNVLRPLRSWPLVAAQIMIFACDMEQTIKKARENPKALTDDQYIELAELLRGDGFSDADDRFAALRGVIPEINETKSENLDRVFLDTDYPLYAPSDAGNGLCLPFIRLLPKAIDIYRKMMKDLFIILERL